MFKRNKMKIKNLNNIFKMVKVKALSSYSLILDKNPKMDYFIKLSSYFLIAIILFFKEFIKRIFIFFNFIKID